MSFDFRSDDVLLDIDGVCKKLSISRSSLERLRRSSAALQVRSSLYPEDGDEFAGMPPFPEPTIMLGRSPRWSAYTLNMWINGTHFPSGRRY
jgi:predicted DNA-binding transcriptional regulator AlpA